MRDGHFRSRDKDGSRTIRSAIAELNPMLHANLMAVCIIEPELLPMEVTLREYAFSTFLLL